MSYITCPIWAVISRSCLTHKNESCWCDVSLRLMFDNTLLTIVGKQSQQIYNCSFHFSMQIRHFAWIFSCLPTNCINTKHLKLFIIQFISIFGVCVEHREAGTLKKDLEQIYLN